MSTKVKRIIIASVIAAVVIVIASIAVRACRENRLLEEGSVDVKAVIEKVERRHHEERYQRIRHRVHRQPAYTSYTIYFRLHCRRWSITMTLPRERECCVRSTRATPSS